MHKEIKFTLGVKCAPRERILSDIQKAGLKVVELYLSDEILRRPKKIIDLCRSFPFKYALHAPTDGFNTEALPQLASATRARVVIFHNIYWEEEWSRITDAFKDTKAKVCIENISNVTDTLKFIRRFRLGRCLDLEHLQLECAGIYEEEYIRVIQESHHVHLSGYRWGSDLWHTHLHYSPENSLYLLNLLRKAGYVGFVISEAKPSQQTYKEFKDLYDFYARWKSQKR